MRVRRDPRGRSFRAALILLIGPAIVVALADPVRMDGANLGFSFKEVAAPAGLTAVTVFGGKDANRYLLETTGTGVALFDYDGDGLLDVFLVNGTTLEGFPKGQEPDQPPLPQSRGRHLRGRDGARRRGRRAAGARAPAPATSTTTGTRTSTSRTTARTGSIATAATAGSTDVTARAGLLDKRTPLGHGLRLPRLRPRRQARPPGRELHRPRSRHRAHARQRPVPLQGREGRLRAARPRRRQERALPQSRRRHVRGRLGQVRDHAGQRDLRAGREHARLRRRRLGRRLRRQRLEPERALPQQPRRDVHRRRGDVRLRLQPGRQAAGGDGRRHRRLRP